MLEVLVGCGVSPGPAVATGTGVFITATAVGVTKQGAGIGVGVQKCTSPLGVPWVLPASVGEPPPHSQPRIPPAAAKIATTTRIIRTIAPITGRAEPPILTNKAFS